MAAASSPSLRRKTESPVAESSPPRRRRGAPVVLKPGNADLLANLAPAQASSASPTAKADEPDTAPAVENVDFGRSGRRSGCDSGSGSKSGSSSESESSESDDGYEDMPALPAPVFVAKAVRVTEAARLARESETQREQARAEARWEERVAETRGMVAAQVAREELRAANGGRDGGDISELPDDRDGGEDDDVQYALWKVRELKRVMREREAEATRAAAADRGRCESR